MPKVSFSYATVRVVPRVEREEFLNCGVVVFSLERKYLAARVDSDFERLQSLWPMLELDEIAWQLRAFLLVCEGASEGGPVAQLPARERFHWLVAPRSTLIQCSAVHTGLTEHPVETLHALYRKHVAVES